MPVNVRLFARNPGVSSCGLVWVASLSLAMTIC